MAGAKVNPSIAAAARKLPKSPGTSRGCMATLMIVAVLLMTVSIVPFWLSIHNLKHESKLDSTRMGHADWWKARMNHHSQSPDMVHRSTRASDDYQPYAMLDTGCNFTSLEEVYEYRFTSSVPASTANADQAAPSEYWSETVSTDYANDFESVLIIGGTDGSGTRSIVQTLAKLGVSVIVEDPNTLDVHGKVMNGWPPVATPLIQRYGSLHYALDTVPKALQHNISTSLKRLLGISYMQAMAPKLVQMRFRSVAGKAAIMKKTPKARAKNIKFAFKAPISMGLCPFWADLLPNFKFLHVIRDGRDIAFSKNQSPVKKFYDHMYNRSEVREEADSVKAIRLWSDWNVQVQDWAVDYAASIQAQAVHSDSRAQKTFSYLNVHTEDLVSDSVGVRYAALAQLAEWVGSTLNDEQICCMAIQDASYIGSQVNKLAIKKKEQQKVEERYGKWKSILNDSSAELANELMEVGAEGLDRFGYEPMRDLAGDEFMSKNGYTCAMTREECADLAANHNTHSQVQHDNQHGNQHDNPPESFVHNMMHMMHLDSSEAAPGSPQRGNAHENILTSGHAKFQTADRIAGSSPTFGATQTKSSSKVPMPPAPAPASQAGLMMMGPNHRPVKLNMSRVSSHAASYHKPSSSHQSSPSTPGYSEKDKKNFRFKYEDRIAKVSEAYVPFPETQRMLQDEKRNRTAVLVAENYGEKPANAAVDRYLQKTFSTANSEKYRSVLVIGGTDGSGTRGVVQLLGQLGVKMVAEDPNTLDIHGAVMGGWPPVANPILDTTHNLHYSLDAIAKPLRNITSASLKTLLGVTYIEAREPNSQYKRKAGTVNVKQGIDAIASRVDFGFKAPISMGLCPFWADLLPNFKFLHVIRDGRDIAFSKNQSPVKKFYDHMYNRSEVREEADSVKAIQLWSDWNVQVQDWAADYASTLQNADNGWFSSSKREFSYFALHSEDTVSDSVQVRFAALTQLAEWVGSNLNEEDLCCIAIQDVSYIGNRANAREIKLGKQATVSARYGKWKDKLDADPKLAEEIHAKGAAGLELFGYEPMRELAPDDYRAKSGYRCSLTAKQCVNRRGGLNAPSVRTTYSPKINRHKPLTSHP